MLQIGPGNPLVFTHIPKTAGTSVTAALRVALSPRVAFTGYDRTTFGDFEDFHLMGRAARATLVLSDADLPANAEFVAGHLPLSTTRRRFPDSPHFTVLREPRVRIFSHWLFNRGHTDSMLRHWGPYADRVKLARLPLAEYCERPEAAAHTDNVITRFLLWPHRLVPAAGFIDRAHEDALFEDARAALSTMGFVGLVEDGRFAHGLSQWLGRPLAVGRANETLGMPRADATDVMTEAARATEALTARSRIDARLWCEVATAVRASGRAIADPDSLFRAAVGRYEARGPARTYDRVRQRVRDALARRSTR